MELSNLRPASGAVKTRKRIARGQGSGHGGTSTRGHKGDKARSGFKNKRHFEGGQTPMQRRLPKRGFKNVNQVVYVPLNLSQIESLVAKLGTTSFDVAALVAAGVSKASDRIKVLGNGKINSKVTLKVHAVSATAKAAIEACGGSVETV
jgi:large subunit ribosomal protein L15